MGMRGVFYSFLAVGIAFGLSAGASPAPSGEHAAKLAALRDAHEAARAEFKTLVDQRRQAPQSVTLARYREAARAYILTGQAVLAAAAQEPGSPPVYFDHGPRVAGDEKYVLHGRKWGSDSPFTGGTDVAGPGTPGGAVTYSFMSSSVRHDPVDDDVDEFNTPIESLTGFQPCFFDEIELAFEAWSAVADIQFIEVTDSGHDADDPAATGAIRIGAHSMDGPNNTLAHGFLPPTTGSPSSLAGDLHFDIAETWSCDGSVGFDIGLVALHELGHAIGLLHEVTDTAVMNALYNAALTELQPDDIEGAVAIYGASTNPLLSLIKSFAPELVLPGDTVTYTITIVNNSNADATSVTVEDNIPAGMTYVADSASGGGTFDGGENRVTWNLGTITSGSAVNVTFDVTVDAGQADITIDNRASVMADGGLFSDYTISTYIGGATCGFADGFEGSSAFGSVWTTAVTGAGRVRVFNNFTFANTGNRSAFLELDSGTVVPASAQLILNASLAGKTDIVLDFAWRNRSTFDDSDLDADGVFIRSDSGGVFVKIFDFHTDNLTVYEEQSLDLDALAAANSVSLTDTFQIMFQWVSDGTAASNINGYFIDDVALSCVDATTVAVPNVVGLTQAAAETAITGAGLIVGTVTQQNSDTVPAGEVISQNPLPDTQVTPGSAVDLVVSLGPLTVAVPNVVGLTQAAAETAITGAGLIVGTVTQQNSDTVPAGEVISQNPLSDTQVAPGSAVDLVVSSGPAGGAVPDVVGQNQDDAETAIVTSGFTVGAITFATSDTVAEGVVIAQDPLAGTLAAPGSAISLTVSIGPVGAVGVVTDPSQQFTLNFSSPGDPLDGASIVFPPDSLDAPAAVFFIPDAPPAGPPTNGHIALLVTCGPSGLTFDPPAQFSLPWPHVPEGVTPVFTVAFRDPQTGEFDETGIANVAYANGFVTFTASHFSDLAVVTLAGDVNVDGARVAVDVQLTINGALDIDIGVIDADIDNNGAVNSVDVQLAILGALAK